MIPHTAKTDHPGGNSGPGDRSTSVVTMAFLDHPVPFAIAHQGGTDVAPGNTEAAFQHAVALGYRYIETDVHATADGVLAVFHDDELGPLTGEEGSVADYTWAELSEFAVAGEHPIPRLDQIVERFPDIRFNVDPKSDGAVEPLIELIEDRDLGDRICVGSFSDARLARIRRALPELCSSPGPRGAVLSLFRAVLGIAVGQPYQALQIPTSVVGVPVTGRWLVGRYQRLGLQVHVWTINTEPEMRRLLDNGVDAIITDSVGLAKDVLVDRGQWSGDAGPALP